MKKAPAHPPLPANVRRFLAFRVFFNARFYYPVLAVFFVDLGLTLDQYAILNVAWAVSIVLFELPLGAVSDRIGRRPLIVLAAVLMVIEMSVLSFAPTRWPTLLFSLFLLNRVLSGLAEAAASGSDEALAYDTLVERGREKEWPDVLSRLQRRMAAAFLLSAVIGGAVYDPDFVNAALLHVGIDAGLTQAVTARFPIYLTLLLSLGAFVSAVRMREPAVGGGDEKSGLAESWKTILDAGRWIRQTRFVLAVILFFLVLDSVVRLFLTLTSSYYRMIGIPPVLFGVLGAAFAVLGFISPSISKRLLSRLAPREVFAVIAGLALLALGGLATARSWAGAFFVIPLALSFQMLGFFTSQYLNESTSSSRRATVLSFKSLAGNLAYGAVGGLYAVAYRAAGSGGDSGGGGEALVLARTLLWMPIVLAAVNVPLWLWGRRIPRMRRPMAAEDAK